MTALQNEPNLESAIRKELLRHVGGWLDNGTDKIRCICGHRGQWGELHTDHVAKAVAHTAMESLQLAQKPSPMKTPVKTRCLGFRWIGQSFARCDLCGDPFWEHDFDTRIKRGSGPFGDEQFEYIPISDEDKAACRAKWGSPR